MKRMILLLTVLDPWLGPRGLSQKCDCLIFPVAQDCKETCGIRLLQSGTKQQLTSTLKLEEKTAEKIVATPGRKAKKTVQDFRDALPYSPYLELETKFSSYINGNSIVQQNTNGDNVGRDKITNINYTVKDSLGGIIESPKSPADFYHNARFYAISGNIKESKKSYQQYLSTDQEYVDTHFFYQELLKNTSGIEEAKNVYNNYLQQHPSSALYQFMQARLQDRKERMLLCKKIYAADSSYMPVLYQLAVDYSKENMNDATTTDKIQRRKYLERFHTLNTNNAYFKYFLDKSEGISAVDYMETRLNESKNTDEFAIANQVNVGIYQADENATLTFQLAEHCYEIFYALDSDTSFRSTGFMEQTNPATNAKFANIIMAFPDLSIGKHRVAVKYINLHHELVGPYVSTIEVLTKTAYALKTFQHDILTTTWPKWATVVEMKDIFTITLMNISTFDIFDKVTLQGLTSDKEIAVYANGKNLTKEEGAGFFYFDKIPKGKYNIVFRLYYIDKTAVAIKFSIDVLHDDGQRNYTGQIVN